TGSKVQHRFSFAQVGYRGWVAASERGQLGRVGQGVAVSVVVEAGTEGVALLVGDHGRLAAAARITATRCDRRRGVSIAHALAQLIAVARNRLRASAAPAGPGLVLGTAALAL